MFCCSKVHIVSTPVFVRIPCPQARIKKSAGTGKSALARPPHAKKKVVKRSNAALDSDDSC